MSNTKQTLPKGWRWAKLTELIASLETGSRPKGGAYGITSGVPSLSAEHITNLGSFDFTNIRYVPREFYEQMSRGHIKQNDILIVKDGATTGKTIFIDDNFPLKEAVVNEHVFLCRSNQEIVFPLYLFYFLWSPVGQAQIRLNFQGAAIGGINQSFTENVILPLPPLDEQKHIVAHLVEQMHHIKQARQAAEESLSAAWELPSAYLNDVFTSENSKTWAMEKLGNLTTFITDGPHVTPKYKAEGIPFLTIRNIVNRKIDLSNVSYISPEDHAAFCKRVKAEKGDILYTKDGTLGIPCVVDTDLDFSFFVSVAVIKLMKDRLDPYFVAYALESPQVLTQVQGLGMGAGLKHMVIKSIKALEIPVPSLQEQKKIAEEITNRLNNVKQITNVIESQLAEINELPSALLRQAFAGKL